MSTTTIRIPDELKARIAAAAEREGKSTHSFILEALAERADQAERMHAFYEEADTRADEIDRTGRTLSVDEIRAHIDQLTSTGENKSRPKKRHA